MEITGIIAEYNPFHNGHKKQIDYIKKSSDSRVAVIMSGDFVQRGEPAILDKWTRARMALLNGADIVLELPVIYATANADMFAYGAVKILDSLDCIDRLCFGAETDETGLLSEIAELYLEETPELAAAIKDNLSKGYSYPKSRDEALSEVYGTKYSGIMNQSNNILAVEYLKALKMLNSPIQPVTIKREGSYSSLVPSETNPSALSIRNALLSNNDLWKQCIPENTIELYIDNVKPEAVFRYLLYKLRSASGQALDFRYISEGLDSRILDAAKNSTSYNELLNTIKSKRYTLSRIKRILTGYLLNITDDLEKSILNEKPSVRVLGFRKDSSELLSIFSRSKKIELITNGHELKQSSSKSIELDILASNIYGLLSDTVKPVNTDYTNKTVII